MKTRKKLVFTLLAVCFTFLSFSQQESNKMGEGSSEERARTATEKQKETLGLSEEQEEEMYAHNLKYIKEMDVIMEGGKSMSTMMKLKDMSGRKDKEAKAILNKEQYKIYQKNKEERRAEMRKKMKDW